MAEREMNFIVGQGKTINPDNGRAVVNAPFGIACYAGSFHDGHYTGQHQGVVGTLVDANAWLRGEQPLSLIRIFNDTGE